ncbi:MAG: hypothetical protein H7257_12605 [Taibaiella sp.]|nr:hypothetical protein [Taibaiella sp.]
MDKGIKITDELANINSSLADKPRVTPYTIPGDYFNQLPENIAKLIAAEGSLPDTKLPYTVPEGYFGALPADALLSAKSENLNYTPAQPKKQFKLPVIHWAAAAALLAVITLGGYIMFIQPRAYDTAMLLASVPGNEIQAYINHNYGIEPAGVTISSTVSSLNVDNTDITKYLNETGWE